jgi:hypothetical protein
MSFSSIRRNNTRPNRRLVPPPPIRRNIPQPQMSRPIQPVRPPTGMPQQISAPTGLPNINKPPLGLPNQMQQPTGLPPTQMQLPTPSVTQPVEQSQSMFAPPVEQTQPAINPVFQPPQTAGPVSPAPEMPMMQQPAPQPEMPSIQPPNVYGNLTPGQALGGEFTMQQPAQQNQRDPQYNGMPDEMYASMIKDKQMNNGQGPIDNMVRPWQQWEYNQSQQTTGPIAPTSTSY